ncbi:hypothetical protein [Methylorubrum suomiense]|uniref:Uncharacterized protein n=1 Tax=Methylorubrum suomiense TaxID=144191 RepID=A0ABQ4V3A9_9HYPH|nr:hypothetical protein [Methylorubrum suomiense]GJE78054.1 hypothetical protein BGCPKDLD_4665 [Methylorubrum suomiense]
MRIATISFGALNRAVSTLRKDGDEVGASALEALMNDTDALVLDGGDPLPGPLRVADLEQAAKLARELRAARADVERFNGLDASGPSVEVIFYARREAKSPLGRIFQFDSQDTRNTAVETVDVFEVVSKHVKDRVEVLERELRALGVDPDA